MISLAFPSCLEFLIPYLRIMVFFTTSNNIRSFFIIAQKSFLKKHVKNIPINFKWGYLCILCTKWTKKSQGVPPPPPNNIKEYFTQILLGLINLFANVLKSYCSFHIIFQIVVSQNVHPYRDRFLIFLNVYIK